jgi:small subunit ribosomal protein S2
MPNIPSAQDLLKVGVHFGHRTERWHPKMEQYIFGSRKGVHIIDVDQTRSQLEKALSYVEELVARGGVILFASTKPQAQDLIAKHATECGMPFVNGRWLGGTLTNYKEIQKLVKRYLELVDKRDKGELKKYTKFEQVQFDREIEDLQERIGGITTMSKVPQAVLVLDMRIDKTAVTEAKNTGVKVIGICDSNVNPDDADYPIPANDDSIGSLMLITRLFADAVKVGKARAKSAQVSQEKK